MLLQQPAESPYDLQFNLAGFPTRISWTFWLVALILGYELSRFVDGQYAATGTSPGAFALLLVWVACMAVSILVHELGHYFACRHHHIRSSYPFFIPAPTLIGTFGAFI
ncbi:MAG: peptidase, partial [Planctomycetaceae bacterium]